MQLPNTSRTARVRRLLAVSAAAVFVMIAPTACDYDSYGGSASRPVGNDMNDTDMPGMDHGNGHSPAQPVVVPVANAVETTAETTSEPAAADSRTTESATAEARRRGEDDRDRRRRGDGRTRPRPTSSAPATATPTGTTAPGTGAPVGTPPVTAPPGPPPVPLGRNCRASDLPAHTGFQSEKAQCVSTAMGEVAPEDRLPSLLITNAPRTVGVGQPFKLVISTRNLVRDRFLGAAAGGYYLESSFLQDGTNLQRGHFHTACRILASTSVAPNSAPAPAFFLATQDNGGGSAPDSVTIDVPATATATAGEMQCTSWAGDGSHRTPMMSRANQTPAIDSVRITVGGSGRADQANVSAADAQADIAKQAEAERAEAGAQKPDQDGAKQPLPAGIGTAGAATPATTPAEETGAAVSTTPEAPVGNN